jgi:hypothetical protein
MRTPWLHSPHLAALSVAVSAVVRPAGQGVQLSAVLSASLKVSRGQGAASAGRASLPGEVRK